MSTTVRDLSPFFAPRSIAVVGAGERATSSGGAVMQMLQRAGYRGRVVPVNPKRGSIFGYDAVIAIAAVDPPVDLARDRDPAGRHSRGGRPSGRPRDPQCADPARRFCRSRPRRHRTQRCAA